MLITTGDIWQAGGTVLREKRATLRTARKTVHRERMNTSGRELLTLGGLRDVGLDNMYRRI